MYAHLNSYTVAIVHVSMRMSLRMTSLHVAPVVFVHLNSSEDKKKLKGLYARFMIEFTVHSEIFSQTLFDFKKLISGSIELKFQERLLMPSSSPEFLLWWGYF